MVDSGRVVPTEAAAANKKDAIGADHIRELGEQCRFLEFSIIFGLNTPPVRSCTDTMLTVSMVQSNWD